MTNNLLSTDFISHNLPDINTDKITSTDLSQSEAKRSLVEKYLRETLIISSVDKSSVRRVADELKDGKLNLSQLDTYYKLSDALFKEKLRVAMSLEEKQENKKTAKDYPDSIKQTWEKLINPKVLIEAYRKGSIKQPLNDKQENLANRLSSTPVFVLTNNLDHMIMGFRPEDLKKNIFDNFQGNKYDSSDNVTDRISFFFFNPNDALDLKNSITSLHKYTSNQIGVNLQPVGLDEAYRFNRMEPSGTEFRFIPDFDEIVNLLFIYKKYKNIKFDHRQKYGKDYFQGQPIYKILPLRKKIDGQTQILEYTGKYNPLSSKHIFFFTNFKSLEYAWQEFRQRNQVLNLPKTPQVIVYNLEGLLKDYEKKNVDDQNNFSIVTNNAGISLVKEYSENQQVYYNFTDVVAHKFKYQLTWLKIWVDRLIWALRNRDYPI
uniref:hypothetical protein n=1 Tax=Timspurckia oligopyrenoides TaxID=708627 RepID=UPI001FCD6BCC|nr:hypothetical protein MW591_pgp018 [Timspurckia oligopyrenoides]UNJ17597.1 hypothetical protein [Timspurckia oligopyrenoides]